jgi:hypothetical protein
MGAHFRGQTQMVVKMVVASIAKLNECADEESNTSKGPAAATESSPLPSPAYQRRPNARREPIDAAGHHTQL